MAGVDNLTVGSKNLTKLTCQRCKCLLLNPSKGTYTIIEDIQLPSTNQVADTENVTHENAKHFWLVDSIYTFENMGFSRTVDTKKYLACPECEFGPLGFHETSSEKSYLSLDRVKEEKDIESLIEFHQCHLVEQFLQVMATLILDLDSDDEIRSLSKSHLENVSSFLLSTLLTNNNTNNNNNNKRKKNSNNNNNNNSSSSNNSNNNSNKIYISTSKTNQNERRLWTYANSRLFQLNGYKNIYETGHTKKIGQKRKSSTSSSITTSTTKSGSNYNRKDIILCSKCFNPIPMYLMKMKKFLHKSKLTNTKSSLLSKSTNHILLRFTYKCDLCNFIIRKKFHQKIPISTKTSTPKIRKNNSNLKKSYNKLHKVCKSNLNDSTSLMNVSCNSNTSNKLTSPSMLNLQKLMKHRRSGIDAVTGLVDFLLECNKK